jgi:peptidoglycan/xylan/chitin deacetylase (PgdA/CDA1 family)
MQQLEHLLRDVSGVAVFLKGFGSRQQRVELDHLVEFAQRPKMMSIGLHGRISGQPARAMALARFLDHVRSHDRVWVCRREDIARHWWAQHPAPTRAG